MPHTACDVVGAYANCMRGHLQQLESFYVHQCTCVQKETKENNDDRTTVLELTLQRIDEVLMTGPLSSYLKLSDDAEIEWVPLAFIL